MKKVLLFILVLGFFSSFALATPLANRQVAKINAKQTLKFPQPADIEQSVIDAAKDVYEKNQNDFAAVYNYAVTLSAGRSAVNLEGDDVGVSISDGQVELAMGLFQKALTLRSDSALCFAGLGFLKMYKSGLYGAFYAQDHARFRRLVEANPMMAREVFSSYLQAKQNGYPDNNELHLGEVISLLQSTFSQIQVENQFKKK